MVPGIYIYYIYIYVLYPYSVAGNLATFASFACQNFECIQMCFILSVEITFYMKQDCATLVAILSFYRIRIEFDKFHFFGCHLKRNPPHLGIPHHVEAMVEPLGALTEFQAKSYYTVLRERGTALLGERAPALDMSGCARVQGDQIG